MTQKEQLIELYANNSKHSNYQILPERLSPLIGTDGIKVRTRYERERLDYILSKIDVREKTIVDIGGNSGYFTFELIDAGAKQVRYYEGNPVHVDFVKLASKILEVENRLLINNKYFSFEDELKNEKQDIILLLNVLHHIGDDYGCSTISLEKAKKEIIRQLNSLADKTDILVFQLGFNWKGNGNTGLFENGTKQEMIEFIEQETTQNWEIKNIGIADKIVEDIRYNDLNEHNIQRNDSLGEFLNRPLFIMKSKTLS
jgi:SAM-dependent methyltransferase